MIFSNNTLNSQNKDKSLNNKYARRLYVCVGCKTPLFTNKDIIDHGQVMTSASMGRAVAAKNLCTNFFVKEREWMITSEAKEKDRGVLECYRKVCKRKLGHYSVQGVRCNCGKAIKPGFLIAKNKVKLVESHSTHINLGASNNSLTNLLSSSDLGKYPIGSSVKAASISYGTYNGNTIRDNGVMQTPEEGMMFHDSPLDRK